MSKDNTKNKSDQLERSIYKYILQHTSKDQVVLVCLTLISMPFVYFSLDVPKTIINKAIGGGQGVYNLVGFELSQVQYLLALSAVFLLLVIFNGMMKYVVNVYRGVMGERMLRRLRFTLYSRIMRFPLPHFRKVSSSEIIPMVTAETEPLGGFIGDSIALPMFQGGLLFTYIYFIFVQDVWLGLAAIALYPPQLYVIPKLQKKVNDLARQRIQKVRKLADRVGETVNGIADIRINDTGYLERADVSSHLGTIFGIRTEIYRRKFFIKFLNNFLGQLTPFFFYSIGGYLVLKGDLSLGALVAVLAAYKDIGPPWKELLKFYQITEDARIKYAQIIQQFAPDKMLSKELHETVPQKISAFRNSIKGTRVNLTSEHHSSKLENLSFDIKLGHHVGVYSSDSDAGTEIAQLIVGLNTPSSGSVKIDEVDIETLPEAVVGRNIGFCSPSSYVFNTSVRNNLYYGLKHQPVGGDKAVALTGRELKESIASGNSRDAISADWVDYHLAGANSESQFKHLTSSVIDVVELKDDIIGSAMRSLLQGDEHRELMETIISVRSHVREALTGIDDGAVIETFDRDTYSENMTVAENLLFGTPVEKEMTVFDLAQLPAVQDILDETGLHDVFVGIGLQLTELMLELFSGVDEQSELFSQYSFIEASRFDEYQQLVDKAKAHDLSEFSEQEQSNLILLTLQLSPARHRLGLIGPELQGKIVVARRLVMNKMGENNELIQFIERENYQAGMTVQENLLFGKISHNKLHLQSRIDEQLNLVLAEHGITEALLTLGLEFNCGNAGSRLSQNFRRKLIVARALIKDPDILVLDDALATLDKKSQMRIVEKLKLFRSGKNLIWTLVDKDIAGMFDHVLLLENGSLKEANAGALI